MSQTAYLFLRLSALGDLCFALESLRALEKLQPGATVDWVVEDRFASLLEGEAGIRRLIVYPRKALSHSLKRPWLWPKALLLLWRHGRALRRERYDCLLDLHGNLKSGLHSLMIRATRKIGFAAPRAREGAWRFYHQRVSLPEERIHRAEEGLLLVIEATGQALPQGGEAVLRPSEEDRAKARAFLQETKETWEEESREGSAKGTAMDRPLQALAPLVVLAPGSSNFAAFKRWPLERFQALARHLRKKGCRVLINLGPGEETLGKALCPFPLWKGGEQGLRATLALLKAADLVIAADSGALHLASAVGTPSIALFGPKDERAYGPRHPASLVLRYPVPCAPCGKRSCPAPICVRAIPVQAVLDAALEKLQPPNL